MYLESLARIEGLLFLHFVALLVRALVEREILQAMLCILDAQGEVLVHRNLKAIPRAWRPRTQARSIVMRRPARGHG